MSGRPGSASSPRSGGRGTWPADGGQDQFRERGSPRRHAEHDRTDGAPGRTVDGGHVTGEADRLDHVRAGGAEDLVQCPERDTGHKPPVPLPDLVGRARQGLYYVARLDVAKRPLCRYDVARGSANSTVSSWLPGR